MTYQLWPWCFQLNNYFPFSQRIARIFESGFLGHLSTQESVTLLRPNATRLKIWKTVVQQFGGPHRLKWGLSLHWCRGTARDDINASGSVHRSGPLTALQTFSIDLYTTSWNRTSVNQSLWTMLVPMCAGTSEYLRFRYSGPWGY